MTSADNILDQIDDTLSDWTGSADSMHWTADEPTRATGPQVWAAPVGTDPDADGWQSLGVIGELDLEIGEFTIDPQAVASQAPAVTWEEVRQAIIEVQATQARRAQAILDVIRQSLERLAAPAAEAADSFRHLPEAVGCDECRPPAPPRDRPAWQSKYGPARRRR